MTTDPASPRLSDADLATLFEAHFPDVWRFARRRCASAADADDVAAETFAVMWRRRADIPPAETRLWLFGIARKVLSNQRRSATRQERVRLRLTHAHLPDEGFDDLTDIASGARRALATLSEEQRDLLLMQVWDGLSVREMAAIMGCTENAVSLRLFKARRKLAKTLGRKENPGSGHVADGSPTAEGRTS